MAKVMGTEKQLRSVEKTRMGELKKLKHESEGSLEQHKINLQSFRGSPPLSFHMFFEQSVVPPFSRWFFL